MSDDASWTYSKDFACPATNTAYPNGVYYSSYTNTATITETGQSDSALVEVHCYVPIISKTAIGTYDEIHDWEVFKSVNPTQQNASAGETVNFTWTVRVDETVHGEDYLVTGKITVVNPNPEDAMTVALSEPA